MLAISGKQVVGAIVGNAKRDPVVVSSVVGWWSGCE
jgi:hypothetical protein